MLPIQCWLLVKHWPIFNNFGGLSCKMLLSIATSPYFCFYTTWGSENLNFDAFSCFFSRESGLLQIINSCCRIKVETASLCSCTWAWHDMPPEVPAEHVWSSCLCRGCASNLEFTVWLLRNRDLQIERIRGAVRLCAIKIYITRGWHFKHLR